MRRDRDDTFSEANIIIASALVDVGKTLVLSSGNVSQLTNDGTGGANYDYDVVLDTAANGKPNYSGAAVLFGASGMYLSTPDTAAYNIAGDRTFIVRHNPSDHTPSSIRTIFSQWGGSGNRCFYLEFRSDGKYYLN